MASSVASTSRTGLIDCTACGSLPHSVTTASIQCDLFGAAHVSSTPDSPSSSSTSTAADSSSSGHSVSTHALVCCDQPSCLEPTQRPSSHASVDLCEAACLATGSADGGCSEHRLAWHAIPFDVLDCDQCQVQRNDDLPFLPSNCCTFEPWMCDDCSDPGFESGCCQGEACFTDDASTMTTSPGIDCPDCILPTTTQTQKPRRKFDVASHKAVLTVEPTASDDGIAVASSTRLLNDLLKGLDDNAVQEILNCCCCAPEIEQDPGRWDISHHDSHRWAPHHRLLLNVGLGASEESRSSADPATTPLDSTSTFAPHDRHDCGWAHCRASFDSHASLATHVNQVHLGDGWSASHSSHSGSTGLSDDRALICSNGALATAVSPPRRQISSLNQVTAATLTSSSNLSTPSELSAPTAPPSSVPWPRTDLRSAGDQHAGRSLRSYPHRHRLSSKVDSTTSGPYQHRGPRAPGGPSTTLPAAASDAHLCRWTGCSARFDSSAELMSHLSVSHVGSGKSSYECQWEGCARSGSLGRSFAQRQKVMRHLQTHTQDRPFVCDICDKAFSEALTLAQHKRIHTQEKPHKCTWEGCDKAFASASALTIHWRTHTGDRPFACSHPGCSAAFAESSNLAKHARTHRSERAYACDECGKRFLRSDQLARHRKIHEREQTLS